MNPDLVLNLIEAFRRSKTMFAAVALGVFDGRREPGVAMDRLLDACVSLGLLEKRGSEFVNTPAAAEYLASDSPRSLAGYIRYSNTALYPMWAHLEEALRDGGPLWRPVFGFDGPHLFSHFFHTEEATRDFLVGMHGLGQLSSPSVVAAFDLGRFRRLVDLGGATGHLALAALERYPQLSAAVFDLPEVLAIARQHTGDRVELIAGDFFADPLPEADLYALGKILHDWREPKISALLQKIFERLPSGGALLLAEMLLADDKSGPAAVHMQSLNMLVCTEGRERTLAEYAALLQEAGFHDVQGKVTGAPLDAVIAVKR